MLSPVTLAMSYADVPLCSLDRIEVYANDNCMAYSVRDKKRTDCVSKSHAAEAGALP